MTNKVAQVVKIDVLGETPDLKALKTVNDARNRVLAKTEADRKKIADREAKKRDKKH